MTTMAAPMIDLVERRDAKHINFGDGERVCGVLVRVDSVQVGGKYTTRFTLEEGDVVDGQYKRTGEFITFLGTYQIETKIMRRDIGHYLDVRCTGTSKDVVRDGKGMKLFQVFVSAHPVNSGPFRNEREDGTVITSADVSF